MKTFGALLGLCLIGLGGAVKAEQYLCTMNKLSTDGFVPRAMLVDLRADGTAFVFDGVVASVSTAPIQAKLDGSADTQWTLRWEIKNIPMSSGAMKSGRVAYKASFKQASGAFRVRVILAGFDNSPWGEGKCTPAK